MTDADFKQLSEDVRNIRHDQREIRLAIVGSSEVGLVGMKQRLVDVSEKLEKFESWGGLNRLDEIAKQLTDFGKWRQKVEVKAATIAGGVSMLVFIVEKLTK